MEISRGFTRTLQKQMICINCKERESVGGKRCVECKGFVAHGVSPHILDTKWRVPIKECEFGHRHVPVRGRCLVCDKERNHEKETMSDMSGDTEESNVFKRWVL